MTVYISLLRGINVGGAKKIKMATLKELYDSWGFENVQTLLQSGNVVFESGLTDKEAIVKIIESGIRAAFGFESKIILRTCDELQDIFSAHPFTKAELEEPSKLLVMFLQSQPGADALQALQDAHSGTETIRAVGQTLYIVYPDGMGRSKLDHALVERKLKITTTGRNWNTVTKLIALCQRD